ncbi:tyrosine-protein phosphatase 69D-like isoform X2 [Varroa jacobsoni]|uniref:tyrosine-protein phosphatase 69D-like isoform X2 n=1 Tax=Varroa jacobsoni TaxID=62625 RepID=UPI000BF3AAE9|nr:tyrosine-protein phosphatase 69D-like isoform X2 [Varroa jacobsoni]
MLLVWSRGPLASGPSDPWWLAVGRNETTVTTSDSISVNNATSSSGGGVSANERSTTISVTSNGGGSESQSPASLPIADSGVTANRGNGAHRIVDLTHDSHAQVVGDGTVQDDDVTSSSQLLLNDLSREQNATYYCYAYNAENNMTAMSSHHVQVIEPPELNFNKVTAEDSRTVKLRWQVRYPNNQPVARYHLQVKNYSAEVDWLDVHNAIPANTTSYTVGYLAPGVTYGFRVAGVNNVGVGEWVARNITMPPDVPPKINQVHLLATTNNTLVFAWQRPPHNNGATISQYNFQLLHDQQLHENRTMAANENSTRSNYMFVYVALTPGDSYAFQVRACNAIGCGNWSDQLDANTSDGTAGAPLEVQMKCFSNDERNMTYTLVTWKAPTEARGTIQGYNITLEGSAIFRRETGALETENVLEAHEVNATTTQFRVAVKPHTNYTVRVCTINRAGCGNLSGISVKSACISPPIVPPALPRFNLEKGDHDKQLRLKMIRVSERVAEILCYRVVLIKLPIGDIFRLLPRDPTELNVTSWEMAHKPETHIGAYVAESIPSEELPEEVILGDLQGFHCDSSLLVKLPQRLRGISNRHNVSAQTGAVTGMIPTSSQHGLKTKPSGKSSTDDEELRRLQTIDDIATYRRRRTVYLQGRQLHRRDTSGIQIDSASSTAQPSSYQHREIYDGLLSSKTNYTGYVEIHVRGENGTVLSRQSGYFPPVETGADRTAVAHDSPAALFAALLSGLLLVILMLLVLVCLIRKKSLKLYTDPASVKEPPPTSMPIKAHNLPAAFIKRHADNDHLFQNEFDLLPDKFKDRTTYASDAPENAHKNRYPDIKAYDQTRVKLTPLDSQMGSDYINANVVEGWRNTKTYLCSQGPTDKTLHDFWRMIWEQGVTVVVMLTGIEEHGKSKCAQYWADLGAKEIEKEFIVGVLAVRHYADYCVRKFLVNRIAGGITEEREILQFHYTMWKDFLTPEQPSWILRFVKRVNEHYVPDRGPLLVHCSAGVGRTGTFVAIDMLLDDLEGPGDQVDIFSCVSYLRHQRMHLVQTTKQYVFIYRALMEHAHFGDSEIEIGHLRDHYLQLKEKTNLEGKDGLALEFEKLNDVIEDQKSCLVGQMEANQTKNRYNFILPYDINRVILPSSPSRDNSSYINASFIQGYDRSQSFIVTQDPLDTTVVDFWRMIIEQNISTIVMLSELGCSPSQTKCHPYWPVNSELICDYVKVKFVREEANDFYIRRDFDIVNAKSLESHGITQLQHKGWVGQIEQDSCISILAVIDAAQMSQASARIGLTMTPGTPHIGVGGYISGAVDPAGPICVHCSGGGDRSSVFVTLFELIQQLRAEERVDVFQAARFTRSQRPCTLQTANQYEFLYRGLLTYIETHQLCDMADTQL